MTDTKALREALEIAMGKAPGSRPDAVAEILVALPGLLDERERLEEWQNAAIAGVNGYGPATTLGQDLCGIDVIRKHCDGIRTERRSLKARVEQAEAERDEALRKQRIDQEQCDHVTAEAAQMADDLASLAEKERQKDTDLMHALQREDELRTDLADLHKKMADAEIAAWDKGFEVGCHEGGRHVMQRLKETEADLAALREVAQASVAAIPPCPCCGEQWVCAADCTFRHDAYEAYVIQRDRRELLSALHSILSPDPDTEPKT